MMVETAAIYDRLAAAASLEGDDGAIRIAATYEPGAGLTAKVSPPTYRVDSKDAPPYVVEKRYTAGGELEDVVLLDSRQSQANRCEEELQRAIDDDRLAMPFLQLDVGTHDRAIRITSLTAPHRSRDAYFRDAQNADGTVFDKTPLGQALASVTPQDATALFLHSPADLVYGVWDSHRGLRMATKFARAYTSEMIGHGAEAGVRAAGRSDAYTSGARPVGGKNGDWDPKAKGTRLSEVGLGSIPPTMTGAGGVSVRTITRSATLSFAGLARIRVGTTAEGARAARAVLAALALVGDRLAFGAPCVFLRSGCDLVVRTETIEWVRRGGVVEAFDLRPSAALALFSYAVAQADAAGLSWATEPVRLEPQPKLQKVIDEAFLAGATLEDGD